MLSNILSGYLILTILLCFFRLRYGLILYLIYIIIVPFVNFLNFGANLLNLLLIIAIFFHYKLKSIDFTPFKPFIFLYIAQLIMIPFHNVVPYEYQFHLIRSDFMSVLLFPFVMHNVMQNNKDAVKSFTRAVFVVIIIAAGYSFSLIFIAGLNPYMMVMLPLNEMEFSEAYAMSDGRVFGRISGVFIHPMLNGLFLGLSSIFLISRLNFKKLLSQKLLILLLFFVLVTTLLMGVRSAIGALGISVAIFLLIEKKTKLIGAAVIGVIVTLFIIVNIPGMSDYTKSIVDPESSKVKGSSIEMRGRQFEGLIEEIEFNPFFGNGFSWTTYYLENEGIHPKMLAFESLLIVILCNSGFAGLLVWIIMLTKYCRLIRKKFDTGKFHLLLTLIIMYLSYSMITGEYGYLKYFMIFYVVIWHSNTNYFKSKEIYKNG